MSDGDWGLAGENFLNPAVEIDLNPLGADEGVAIGRKKKTVPAATAVSSAIKRGQTQGEKGTLRTLAKSKAAEQVRELLTTSPNVVPSQAKAMMMKAALTNPAAAAKILVGPMIAKKQAEVKAQYASAVSQQKAQSVAAVKDVQDKLNTAVKAGVMNPELARSVMNNKVAEIRQKNAAAMGNIKKTARGKVGDVRAEQSKVAATLIKKRDVAVDRTRQKIEAEIRSVSASDMPEPGKSEILKTLKDRLARLDLSKKELTNRKKVATIAQMAAKGVLPKKQAAQLAKKIKGKADAIQKKGKQMAANAKSADKQKGRLYVLGKWIQAYESAIRFAQEAGASSVVIPVGDIKLQAPGAKPVVTTIPSATVNTKTAVKGIDNIGDSLFQSYPSVGSIGANTGTKEVRLPIQTAKANLEKFKMEYKKIEAQLAKRAGEPGLPLPKVIPITQTGARVTPEMLTAQEAHLRQQIAAGKINAVRGAQAINYLKKIDAVMRESNKPILKPKTTAKKERAMVIQVFISPESFKYFKSGERMVTTKSGSGKTQAQTPRNQLPQAIPHATAKTVGTVAQMVKTQPATVPSMIAAKPAQQATSAQKMTGQVSTSRLMSPAASIQKPGTITPNRQPRTFAPFKRLSLTEMLNQMIPPIPQLKKR